MSQPHEHVDAYGGHRAPQRVDRLLAGRYRLLAPIGSGGMGAVWKARDELLARDVAVKEIQLPGGIPAEDRDELVQRSLREARNAGRLRHPSVITVHDVVIEAGQPCIVMELVPSRSLDQVIDAGGPLPVDRTAALGLAVLGALREAHAAGVLHRDVKPGNVLLGEDGRVVLTDFGIARFEGDSRLTMTGRIMGTPGFLAPELAHGYQAASSASDLWALGATLYVAVEGRAPYDQTSFLSWLSEAATVDPAPMRLAGPLAPLISALLRREPATRPTAEEVERTLAAVASSASAAGPVAPAPRHAPEAGPSPRSGFDGNDPGGRPEGASTTGGGSTGGDGDALPAHLAKLQPSAGKVYSSRGAARASRGGAGRSSRPGSARSSARPSARPSARAGTGPARPGGRAATRAAARRSRPASRRFSARSVLVAVAVVGLAAFVLTTFA